jgi:hypothetical protein
MRITFSTPIFNEESMSLTSLGTLTSEGSEGENWEPVTTGELGEKEWRHPNVVNWGAVSPVWSSSILELIIIREHNLS